MIEGLKPYPEYKESGQKWLGKVPAHWDLKPGHSAFTKRKVSNVGMKEDTVLSLSYGRIKVKPTDRQHGLVPESYETYQIVDDGNLIIRGTDLQNDHTSLRIGLSRNRGIISSAYLCLEARETITPDYGYQILNTFDLTKAIYRYGSGLRQNLDHGEIKRLPIFLPPLDEQAAIVRFLDHANRKIDGFIRAKRKLIGLLNEQKQAIIHRAVTRGLDHNAKLKPSGNFWLGDIPNNWEIHRAKFLFTQVTPPIPEDAAQVTCFRDGQVTLRSNRRTTGFTNAIFELGYQGIKPGQLVLHSMDAFAGAIGICDSHGKCSPEYVICEPMMDGVHPPYYARLLRTLALQGLFVALCPSVRQRAPRVRFNDFGGFSLPKPPPDEQERIIAHIEIETRSIDTAITRTEREIALMQEYRTRLTADVVTGKLDVREAAAKLPDPVAEQAADSEIPEEDTELEEAEA